MLLFRLLVTHIVIRVQVLAGGLQRFMPQIVADRAQVNRKRPPSTVFRL